VRCRCGFAADAEAVREVAYLRAGLPAWIERLAQLESSFAAGAPASPATAAGSPGPSSTAPKVRVSGAYAALVSLGAILVVAGILALTVVLWQVAGPLGQAALMASAAVLIAACAVIIRRRIPATAQALAVIAVLAWLAFAVLTARSVVGLKIEDAGWTLALASTAVWTGLAGWRWRLRSWRIAAAICGPAAVSFAAALVAQRVGGAPALVVAGTVVGLVAVVLAWRTWGLPSVERWLAVGTAAFGAAVLAVSAVAVSHGPATFAWLIGGVLVVAAACAAVPSARPVAPLLVGLAAGLTAGLGWASIWPSAVVVSVIVLVGMLARRVPWAFLAPFGAALVWAFLAVATHEGGQPDPWWAYVLVLAVWAIAVAARAVVERRAEFLVLSVPASVIALLWSLALATDVGTDGPWLERFTVPLAILLVAYGLLAAWLRRGLPSLVTLGPAVAVALWPSAVVGLSDDSPTRLYAVLVAAAVILVVGLVTRLAGLVVPAGVALVLVALRPLSLLMSWVPNWVAYTAAGTVLIVIGARFEHVRSRAVSVRHWAQGFFR
jgi:hypothetical protein